MLSRKDGESSNKISRKARGIMFRSMSPLSGSHRRMKKLDDEEPQSESDAEGITSASRRLLMDNVGNDTASNRDNGKGYSRPLGETTTQGNVLPNGTANNGLKSSPTKASTAQSLFAFSSNTRGRRDNDAGPPDVSDSESDSSRSTGSSSVKRQGLLARARSRSRSRSSSRSRDRNSETKQIIVAVTSCRSDAYHNQKAPGSTAMLPRKAPSVLKLFHELAVGVKDAYAAMGATPMKPDMDANGRIIIGEDQTRVEAEGRKVLWEFMGNLDFLLAVVDEVAVDTATRGALKDDSKFKVLRDTIKKCNKVLEVMLVRRERKYTLFFRLATPTDEKEITAMKKWNAKVEKAVGAVTEPSDSESGGDRSDEDDGVSVSSMSSRSTISINRGFTKKRTSSFGAPAGSIVSGDNSARGRSALLPSAGKIRARRATPTPRLRQQNLNDGDASDGSAAEDGFSAITRPVAKLALAQSAAQPFGGTQGNLSNALAFAKPVKAKDELVDVIRGLKVEKEILKKNEGGRSDPGDLKPNWNPKADVPQTVPKLPPEYIHRHRLMKQAVNSLLGSTGAESDDANENISDNCFITSITSRHSDKAGNGKTTLAVAAIQTVEVRERFSDGIAWIKLGRKALTEKDIRSLYEDIYEQLCSRPNGAALATEATNAPNVNSAAGSNDATSKDTKTDSGERVASPSISPSGCDRRRFQFGELEGIREDLTEMICKKKILLCLDDVWRAEDACWFLFVQRESNAKSKRSGAEDQKENLSNGEPKKSESPFKVLITTRFSALLGPGMAQEVFVRILTEHEAVKLLIACSGKRAQGGKNCAVVTEAKTVVKGCGNSPLAIRIAGGLLRKNDRWTLSSAAWKSLVSQSKSCLTEATQLRSFSKAFGRIVDLSFSAIDDRYERAALRRCFVMFAEIFESDVCTRWGRGIPENVILGLFSMIQAFKPLDSVDSSTSDAGLSPSHLLLTLEKMNLLEKSRAALRPGNPGVDDNEDLETNNENIKPDNMSDKERKVVGYRCYFMHDAISAVAHEMAERNTPSFAPPDECPEEQPSKSWSTPLRNAAKYLVQIAQRLDTKNAVMTPNQFHVFVVASMIGGWTVNSGKSIISSIQYGASLNPGMEDYMVTYLPSHLIKAKALASAADVLVDSSFISHRVESMGPIEAARQHVADLIEFRRYLSKNSSKKRTPSALSPKNSPRTPEGPETDKNYDIAAAENDALEDTSRLDVGAVLRDACKHMIDEVYRVDSRKSSSVSSTSLNMAICLSTLGEGLLKCRQPRDAMLRLEEAVGMYRGLLGPFHIDVARALSCVAKALVKLGEFRVAVLKFGEAARIYEACNATEHFDALSNSQSMAALLADLGDYPKAEARYEYVIRIRRSLHGNMNPSVARTLNDYAVVLAKHGKINEAIVQYQEARAAFEGAAASKTTFAFVEAGGEYGFIYDAALIDMNIASIKVKGGDIEGAITSYSEGIEKMRQLDKCAQMESSVDGRSRHIIASIGKIGSLKLKLGDRTGALAAFEQLLKECEATDATSTATRTEAAKAHIKCATIRRSMLAEDKRNHEASLNHLREALKLYTQLYGSTHRDSQALATSLRQWEQEGVVAELRLLESGSKR